MNSTLLKKKLQELVSNVDAFPMKISERRIDSNNYQEYGMAIVWNDQRGNILRAQLNDKGIRDIRFYSKDVERLPHYLDVRFNEPDNTSVQLPWPKSINTIEYNKFNSSCWDHDLKEAFDCVIQAIRQALIENENWTILE